MDDIDKLAWERMTFIAFLCCMSGAIGWAGGNCVGYRESITELRVIKADVKDLRLYLIRSLAELKVNRLSNNHQIKGS